MPIVREAPQLDDIFRVLLQPAVRFTRAFADVAGGALPGLFLSQAWYWSERTTDPEGWFYKTQEEWHDETALTRYEQETARKHLRTSGILEEKKQGIPSKLYYKINRETLQACMLETIKQARGKPTDYARVKSYELSEFLTEITTEREVPLGDPHTQKAKRSARKVPPSFVVTEDMRTWALQSVPGILLDHETASFCDYEFRHGRSDWEATWRIWMRKAWKDLPADARQTTTQSNAPFKVQL